MVTATKTKKSSERASTKYLTHADIKTVLDVLGEFDDEDAVLAHAFIFLGFHMGMRISEALLLTRDNFSEMDRGVVTIPTLKQSKKISHRCSVCGRIYRLSARSIGKQYPCSKCFAAGNNTVETVVGTEADHAEHTPPMLELPFVPDVVASYVRHYLKYAMRPEQQYLFERSNGRRISRNRMWTLFKWALGLARLSPRYKPHALRHGCAMWLKKLTDKDMKAVQKYLRHKSIVTTDIYDHMENAEEYRKRMDDAAEMFAPPTLRALRKSSK